MTKEEWKKKILEEISLEEAREVVKRKEEQAIKELDGKRVSGFLLSIRSDSTKGGEYSYENVYADKSIEGQRCLLRLGSVYSLKEAEKIIAAKLKQKVAKDSSFRKFVSTEKQAK